ncbi:oxidoreductase FAD-binding domain-containing protein [Colletotrichum musicola]|uniref:Oxidoreductase FAD-binding domain-containing protein n=1 Tax=Colletotrichum musicola TaxID=2175873 RepID=A0A8H6U706_9PEZI|nr:oxidoreductase FAD-binding domain-containing protein [Colletotrichum musicola]
MNHTLLLASLFASKLLTPDELFFPSTKNMPARTIEWHEGELAVHELLKVPTHRNPTAPGLPASYGHRIAASPLLALGTLDSEGRPWTTIWGGEAGAVARPVAEGVLGVRSLVDVEDDPVFAALWEGREREEVVRFEGGKKVAGLAIDLRTRDRVKIAGRMVAGAVAEGEVQVAVEVEESLGNCPKYLNKKDVRPRPAVVKGDVQRGLPLSEDAVRVVDKADMVFVSSSGREGMDTNHRGGGVGFVRVVRNDGGGLEVIYPEFSGNRLYQTLGNLKADPRVGVAVPDFETADVLYLTGTASILVGKDAAAYLPHTKLAVKITASSAVFVKAGLPFTGTPVEPSPYNPPIRRLHAEQAQQLTAPAGITATLVGRDIITPSIARFTFGLDTAATWEPGQHVTLDFSGELDDGWSHMRDDEPQSLNDDYVRTFTVSNGRSDGRMVEITARRKGAATRMLWRWNLRAPLEVPVLGFGGKESFRLGRSENEEVFVAAGVGITPLIAQAGGADRVLWSVRGEDLGLVGQVLRTGGLAGRTTVFVTGSVGEEGEAVIREAEGLGAGVARRRMRREDVVSGPGRRRKYFLCTGPGMLEMLNGWLEGEDVAWEDFAY